MMYNYEISGYYFEYYENVLKANGQYDTLKLRKYFRVEVEAPDNILAMRIALGDIMMNAENPIKLDVIHYECL